MCFNFQNLTSFGYWSVGTSVFWITVLEHSLEKGDSISKFHHKEISLHQEALVTRLIGLFSGGRRKGHWSPVTDQRHGSGVGFIPVPTPKCLPGDTFPSFSSLRLPFNLHLSPFLSFWKIRGYISVKSYILIFRCVCLSWKLWRDSIRNTKKESWLLYHRCTKTFVIKWLKA